LQNSLQKAGTKLLLSDGAPEEIRTPDPQIRSLGQTVEIIEVRYRKKANRLSKNCVSSKFLKRSVTGNLSSTDTETKVEYSIGIGEVDSSILSGSTIHLFG
jgi:hypothetical protein